MGLDELNKIKRIFLELSLSPEYVEHEEAITSEDAARARGFELKQGIKSLLFTNGKGNYVIVDLPADLKVDRKKVAIHMGWSNGATKMATPQEVMEKTGCEIGAVPPFGHKEEIKVIVDKKVYDNMESDFNIGLRTYSVKIKTSEIKFLFSKLGFDEGDFSISS